MNKRQGAEVLMVIPTYNEQQNIGRVISEVKQVCPGSDILVVDDGSTDNTVNVAKEMNVKIVRFPFNLGYGAALQAGYKYAMYHEYRYVVQMDGDGQHDAKSVQMLLDAIKEDDVDLVIGSRFMPGSQLRYKVGFIRRLGMTLFGSIVFIVTRQKVSDPTSGFQILNRRAFHLMVSDYFPTDYPDADMLIMAHRFGLKFKEAPVTMYANQEQRSMHNGLKPLYYIFKMLLAILVTLLRKIPASERSIL